MVSYFFLFTFFSFRCKCKTGGLWTQNVLFIADSPYSHCLTEKELKDRAKFKGVPDGEAARLGLKDKYELECVRQFLWKKKMSIMPVCTLCRTLRGTLGGTVDTDAPDAPNMV